MASTPKARGRRRLALLGAGLVAVIAIVVVLVAGGKDDDPAEVRATLRDYAQATRQKDYQRLCDELYAPELLENLRNASLPCEVALRTSLEAVQRPTLAVRSVEISGGRALAQVHTDAANQEPADVTIRLARNDGRWRVAALATAQPQPPPNRKP